MSLRPLGPYSLVRKAGNLYFISGLLPIDPSSNKVVEEPKQAFIQAMENLKSVLAKEGLSLNDVVKITVYLKNKELASLFNQIYASYFKNDYPARSLVFVSELPMNALLEIEAVAYK